MDNQRNYSMDWNDSTPYVYYIILSFFRTVRSLFQTLCLLRLGPEVQNSCFRPRKSLDIARKIYHVEKSRLYIYHFLRNFPPVRLCQTMRLFQFSEYVNL